MTAKQFRRFQKKCDEVGMISYIKRTAKGTQRRYEVIINMEVKKMYKTRFSAKKFIVKQYQNIINA